MQHTLQAYLQQRLGQYLTVATINANLLRNLMTAWLVYDEQQQRYVNFDEAAELVQAYKQQQEQQQQLQQAQALRNDQQQQHVNGSSNAAAAAGSKRIKPAVITASIPLEHLLGVKAAAGNGSSGQQQQQQQELAGSGSSSSSSSGSGSSSGPAAAGV